MTILKTLKTLMAAVAAIAITISSSIVPASAASQKTITSNDVERAISWGESANGNKYINRCLAFVFHCFYDGAGIDIYNGGGYATAKAYGEAIISNYTPDPPRGAIVFFNTANPARHVGICLGDGKFIHAWTSGITTSYISDYNFWGWGLPKGYAFEENGTKGYTVGEKVKISTNSQNLTVRSGPGTKYSKVGSIPKGTVVTLTTYPISDGNYYWSYCREYAGYIATNYVQHVSGSIFPEGNFKLIPKCAPNSAIAIQGRSKESGANAWLWSLHDDEGCQQFSFIPVYADNTGEIYYAIKNVRSGKVLDLDTSNCSIIQYSPHYGDNQLFKLVYVNGYYRMECKLNSGAYSIDVHGGKSDDATNLIIYYSDDDDAAQLFSLSAA